MMTTTFLGKLKLWHTFFILSLIGLLLAAIPTFFYAREANKSLGAYQAEQVGLPAMASTLRVIQLTQQHRGLSALVLGGVGDADGKRLELLRDADLVYTSVDSAVKRSENPAIEALWAVPRRDWEALKGSVAGKAISIPDSYAAHTALVAKLLKVNELIGDHYGLSLDPDKDTYQLIQAMYFQLPNLAEELGQLRAKGTGLLAKKEASPADRIAMSAISARVKDRLEQTSNAFSKAVGHNRAIDTKLGPAMASASVLASDIMQLADDQIIKADSLAYDPAAYLTVATKAIDAQFALNLAAKGELETIIDDKISAFHRTRWTMAAAMLGLCALAGYLALLITRSVTLPLNNAVMVARSVASGNLANEFDVGPPNEVGNLLRALKEMNDGLRKIVGDVRTSIDNINAATRDIATGNNDISGRLEAQASNLEETASSMEELTSTVRQNAENARLANELVVGASQVATKGGAVVSQVVSTMGEINDGSRKIVDIIAVIDGIAFQTNILALNAAVEAARAGEQGRGFAVVASEVRNLAQRSASAAKEIKDLIGRSVERVEAGNQLADQAGVAMEAILSSVGRITTIMSDIAVASAQQGSGIEQVNDAVTQMDDMTQQNAALVEQTAAASSSLQDQARTLVDAISIFTLGDEPGTPRTALASPASALATRLGLRAPATH